MNIQVTGVNRAEASAMEDLLRAVFPLADIRSGADSYGATVSAALQTPTPNELNRLIETVLFAQED